MLKCKSCNKPVANSAMTCPLCGDPDCVYNGELDKSHEKKDEAFKSFKVIRGIAFFFFITGLIAMFVDFAPLEPIKKLGPGKAMGIGAFLGMIATGVYFMEVVPKWDVVQMYIDKKKSRQI